jgi:hypothetical protein
VRQLRKLVEEGKGIEAISRIMVKMQDAIRQKVFDLGLKVKVAKEKKQGEIKKTCFFFSSSRFA